MPRAVVAKAGFLRAYHRLKEADRDVVDGALRTFHQYLRTGEAPVGLGVRHVGGRTYEFRAGLALRIVYVVEGEHVVLSLLGNHDEVHRFLKRQ